MKHRPILEFCLYPLPKKNKSVVSSIYDNKTKSQPNSTTFSKRRMRKLKGKREGVKWKTFEVHLCQWELLLAFLSSPNSRLQRGTRGSERVESWGVIAACGDGAVQCWCASGGALGGALSASHSHPIPVGLAAAQSRGHTGWSCHQSSPGAPWPRWACRNASERWQSSAARSQQTSQGLN